MALIKCPECGREISSEARSCPHCGKPIMKQSATPQNDNLKTFLIVAGIVIAAFGFAILFLGAYGIGFGS